MRVDTMSRDAIKAALLHCPIPLADPNGKAVLESGDFFGYSSTAPEVKRIVKAAKQSLRLREINGRAKKGELPTINLGGHVFTIYEACKMFLRDDVVTWLTKHAWEFVNEDGSEKVATVAPPEQEIDHVDEQLSMWKVIRKRTKTLPVTGMMQAGAWNSMWDMKKALKGYADEINEDKKRGVLYGITKCLADQLAACIAYREAHYANAVDFLIDLSAAAMATARWVQEAHAVKPADEPETK